MVERKSKHKCNKPHPLYVVPKIRQANGMVFYIVFFRYPRNQNCIWNITAEEGHFIIVDFDEFELEDPQPGGFCAFDYVTFSGGILYALRY